MINRLCLAFLLPMLLFPGPAAAAPVRNLMAPDAHALLRDRPETFLLDVRTPGEYFQLRLAGAHLIPIEQFLRRQGEVPADRPVLVYCAVGSRSWDVADYLARRGHAEVYNLTGGVWGWKLRGYPILEGAP